MKRICSLLAVMLLILLCTVPAFAAASNTRVEDGAGILTAEEEAKLREKLDKISRKYNMDVLIVTVNSYDEYGIDLFCENYFTKNNRGLGSRADGIMLALSMGTREYYECTHGRAVSLFSEYDLIEMENRFVPLLSSGKYYRAFNKFASRVRTALWWEQVLAGTDSQVLSYIYENQDMILRALLFGFIAGLIIALIRTAVLSAKLKSVRAVSHAENYVVERSFRLTDKQEVFTHKSVTRTERYEERSDGGHGGGGGFSGGSGGGGGGGSFGGHGGHF